MAEGGWPRTGVSPSHRDVGRRNGQCPSSKSNVPCRFFPLGTCLYGDNCRFLHERGTQQSPAQQQSFACNRLTSSQTNEALANWVNAPEFVPTPQAPGAGTSETEAGPSNEIKSYACALDPRAGRSLHIARSSSELCPYFLMGYCRYGEDECTYIHGEPCELCGQPALHPTDEDQRQQHHQDCMKQHEADMELSFAVARSKEKACGICMEIIWDKVPSDKQRFGLLPNCSHCFCLDCIRTWRGQAKNFENKIIRSCPECRVQSDFVCPSRYWCETKEEKQKLIEEYKKNLSSKACKYFNQGRGECPFGNKCFYLHALPDGTKADVGPPQGKHRRRRIIYGPDAGDDEADLVRFLLWDFLEERESRIYLQLGLDFDELDAFFTDSNADDSDDDSSVYYLH